MKKILSLIGAVGLTATSAATAVSFAPVTHNVTVESQVEEADVNISNLRIRRQPNWRSWDGWYQAWIYSTSRGSYYDEAYWVSDIPWGIGHSFGSQVTARELWEPHHLGIIVI